MTDKSIFELFGILVDILGKVEHDGQPYFIGSDLDVFVMIVGVVES